MAKKVYKLTVAEEIWNRACHYDLDQKGLGRGDCALNNLLGYHNPAMNGGLFHPFDVITPKQVVLAQQGYEYFGFPTIASLIEYARNLEYKGEDIGRYESLLYDLYSVEIPSDQAIADRFEAKLKAYPQDFAPWKPEKKKR